MPPKAEYWILTSDEFKHIKSLLDLVSEKLFELLKPEGFQKVESSRDWLGFTICRKTQKFLTTVSLSL